CARGGRAAFAPRWERRPLLAGPRRLPPSTTAARREQRLGNRALGRPNTLRGLGAGAQPPLHHRLPELAMPSLLMAGEEDETYVRIVRDMAAVMPKARAVIVPGAGHTVHLERPESFRALVLAFLRSHR